MRVEEVSGLVDPGLPSDATSVLKNIFCILPDESELAPLMECYSDLGDYVPLPVEHLAGKLVRLVHMPADEEDWDGRVSVILLNPFDFSAIEPSFLLPLPALVEVEPSKLHDMYEAALRRSEEDLCEGAVDELSIADLDAASSPLHARAPNLRARVQEVLPDQDATDAVNSNNGPDNPVGAPTRHRESEQYMVRHLAAETLQDQWKRYQECKPARRHVRRLKEQRVVQGMAADTIKAAFRRHASVRSVASETASRELQPEVQSAQIEDKAPEAVDWATVPLPEGWERRMDSERRRHYYVDHNARLTQWRHPLQTDDVRPKLASADSVQPSKIESSAVAAAAAAPTAIKVDVASVAPERKHEEVVVVTATREPVALDRVQSEAPPQPPRRRSSRAGLVATSAAPSSGTSVLKASRKVRNRSGGWLVLDEAHADAVAAQAQIVTFSPQEAVKLLDALECELSAEVTGPTADKVLAGIPPLNLPMLHQQSLAASLTVYARANFLVAQPRLFSLSEAQSAVAVERLGKMLEGGWHTGSDGTSATGCREAVLQLCAGDLGRTARPSFWDTRQTIQTAQLLGVPTEKFAQLGIDGAALLETSHSKLLDSLGPLPALIQTRLWVLQHTLQLVDQWWELGHRPSDPWRAAAASTLGALCEPYAAAPGTSKRQGTKDKKSRKRAAAKSSHPAAAAAAGAAGPGGKEAGGRWGVLDTFAEDDRSSEVVVEFAPQEALLQAWMPLNRAYGWNVALEQLSALCSRLSGAYGGLSCADLNPPPETAGGPPRGCVWVEINGTVAKAIKDLPSSPLMRISSAGTGSILVPLLCLRKARTTVGPGVGRSAIAADALYVGATVRIADRAVLVRACERFEWWDRPPAEALASMAGQRAIVVGLLEVHSRGRVGVRLPASGLLDAVPLEALLPYRGLPISPEPALSLYSPADPEVTPAVAPMAAPAAVSTFELEPLAAAPKALEKNPNQGNVSEKRKSKRAGRNAALRGVDYSKPSFLLRAEQRLAESTKEVSEFYLNELGQDVNFSGHRESMEQSVENQSPRPESNDNDEADFMLPRISSNIRASVKAPMHSPPNDAGVVSSTAAPSCAWQVLSFDTSGAQYQLGPPVIGESSPPRRKPLHKNAAAAAVPTIPAGRPRSGQGQAHPALLIPTLDPSVGFDAATAAERAIRTAAQKNSLRGNGAFRAGAPNALDSPAIRPQKRDAPVGKENGQLIGEGGKVPEAWEDGSAFAVSGHLMQLWADA